MARRHSGGFVNQEDYWEIGTDENRGRDGDTARHASKLYNDHRHSAAAVATSNDLASWAGEQENVSQHPTSAREGGRIEVSALSIRRPGDLASLNNQMWMHTGADSIQENLIALMSAGHVERVEVDGAVTYNLIRHKIVDTIPIVPREGTLEVIEDVQQPVGTAIYTPSLYNHEPSQRKVELHVVVGYDYDDGVIELPDDGPKVNIFFKLAVRANTLISAGDGGTAVNSVPSDIPLGEHRIDQNIQADGTRYNRIVLELPLSEAEQVYELDVVYPETADFQNTDFTPLGIPDGFDATDYRDAISGLVDEMTVTVLSAKIVVIQTPS